MRRQQLKKTIRLFIEQYELTKQNLISLGLEDNRKCRNFLLLSYFKTVKIKVEKITGLPIKWISSFFRKKLICK